MAEGSERKADAETEPGLIRGLETPPSNYDILAGGRSAGTPMPITPPPGPPDNEPFEPTVAMEPPALPPFTGPGGNTATSTGITSVPPTRPITRTAPPISEIHETPTVFTNTPHPPAFAAPDADTLEDAQTVHQPVPPPLPSAPPPALPDDESSTVQKTDAELAQIQQLLARDPTKFDTLPGEAPEVPTSPPYSLRPAGADGGTSQVDSGQTAQIRMRRSIFGWSGAGFVVGAVAFLGVYFFPPFENVVPFAPIEFSIERINVELPLPLPNRWAGHDQALIGSSPESVVIVPIEAEGAAKPLSVQTSAAIDPKLAAIITEPLFEGVALAWPAEEGIRWGTAHPVKHDKSEGADAEVRDSRDDVRGELPLRSDERIVWAPVKAEDAAAGGPEPFFLVARGPERDTILRVDPESQKRVALVSPARLIANLYPYQPEAGLPAACLCVTVEGAGAILANAEELAPATAKFAAPWPEDSPVNIQRVRLGGGRRGWILARQGALAALELTREGAVTLLAEESVEAAGKDARTAPHLLTFPDGDRPDADRALIALDQSKGILVSFEDAAGGGVKLTRRTTQLPGGEITTFDLNGDGLYDIVGLDTDGTLAVVHGQRLDLAGDRVKTDAPLPASPIRWSATPEGPKAHYLTADGQAVTIRVQPQWVVPKNMADAMRKDRRWRDGQSPL